MLEWTPEYSDSVAFYSVIVFLANNWYEYRNKIIIFSTFFILIFCNIDNIGQQWLSVFLMRPRVPLHFDSVTINNS